MLEDNASIGVSAPTTAYGGVLGSGGEWSGTSKERNNF